MKKRISMLFAFVVVFIGLLGGVSLHAGAYEKSSLPTITFDEEEESTESTAYINSDTNCSNLNLFVAAYKNNQLVGIERKDIELSVGKNTVNTGIDWAGLDKDRIRLFVWNDDLFPYAGYEKNIEISTYEGVVVETPLTDIADGNYDSSYCPMLTINSGGSNISFNCPEIEEPDTYLGKKVQVGARGNFICSVEPLSQSNTVISIAANDLCSSGDRYYDDAYMLGYRESTGGRVTCVDIETGVMVYVNYKRMQISEAITTASIAQLMPGGGRIELISNNGNDFVDVINIIAYTEEAVIEKVYEENGYYSFDTYVGFIDDIDTSDDEVFVKVYIDGEQATLEDIKENYTVTLAEIARDACCYYVSSTTVTGAITAYSTTDNYVEIEGVQYILSPLSIINEVTELKDVEGTFFINADGQITFFLEKDDSSYAIILATGEATGITGGYMIEAVFADGTVAEYYLGLNSYVEFSDGTRTDANDGAVYESIAADMYQVSWTDYYRVAAKDIGNVIYKIKVKNDKVAKLVKLDCDASATGREYDSENMTYGPINFDEETIVASVGVTGSELVEAEDITVGNVADFLVDGDGRDCNLWAFGADNNDIAGLVIGYIPQIFPSADALIVSSCNIITINDEDAYQVNGLQAGEEAVCIIYNENGIYSSVVSPSALKKGDVILPGKVNTQGIIADFETLYTVDNGIIATDDAVDNEVYYIAGWLRKDAGYEPTDSRFFLADGYTHGGTDYYKASDGIAMRDEANCTLVDFSESLKHPEITKKEMTKNVFGSLSRYDSMVFVRYYQDTLKEVIVYRYNV